MTTNSYFSNLGQTYPDLWQRLEEIVRPEQYFELFRQLSDNYSPTLTVSRVQGDLVAGLLAQESAAGQLTVDKSLRRSSSIGIRLGKAPAPVWFSAHADICSYLTQSRNEDGYPLIPFCMPRADAGSRPAVALAAPEGAGPLEIIAEGAMVTKADGSVRFVTEADLPLWTRVVYQSTAVWNRETDEIHGYIDNQVSSAAHILAARVLAPYGVNVQFVINDEEEGPVDKGNQGFSRAMSRLLHRTPAAELPELVVVSDGHGQGPYLDAGEPTYFGRGALFSGASSKARGAVTPPQLVAFNRELISFLNRHGIAAAENPGYVGRSDDISAMQYTQNVVILGSAGSSSHFHRTPTAHCQDQVNLTKALVIYALLAQDEAWRAHYL